MSYGPRELFRTPPRSPSVDRATGIWGIWLPNDVRPTGLMSIAFTIISVLGVIVFFSAGAWPVGILFSGLTGVYVSECFARFQIGARRPTAPAEGGAQAPAPINPGERALGFFHIITGLWLMYPTFATTLHITLKYTLPGG